jgi:hypothetical protein
MGWIELKNMFARKKNSNKIADVHVDAGIQDTDSPRSQSEPP